MIKIDLKFRNLFLALFSLTVPSHNYQRASAMVTQLCIKLLFGQQQKLIVFFYGDLKICGISARRAAMMSSRKSIFFRIPLPNVIYSSKNILFRFIVFRIKDVYKHVDITPSVPLLHLLVNP